MNFIDLCAGIGGFRLGFERAGMKCVGFCEIDKFARKSYGAMYDTKGEWKADDITKVKDEEIESLKRKGIDIIAGGFPCQAFSVAGKRKGFDDTRGTIFFQILRFIRIIKPKTFVCENVKGLLSHDGGRTFGTIISALAELGYCVEWQVLNSKDFGVPQSRERVFIIGHFGDECGRKVFPFRNASGSNIRKMQEITHGVSMHRRIYSTNGLAKTIASNGGGVGAKTGLYMMKDGRVRRLTPRECWRIQGFPDEYFYRAKEVGLSDNQLYKQAGNAVTVNVAEAIGKEIMKRDDRCKSKET